MAKKMVADFSSLINQHVQSHEILSEYLSKAESLAQAAICTDFLDLSEAIVHDYLWTLSDFISQAKNLNEHLLTTLLKERPLPL